ncbi:MAG: LptF/LptG family permease [Candidatus Krumholzibacteria bacterium]|nr:LptF/LptG family permease [Candidatus Krumholzibacteria bacterium]
MHIIDRYIFKAHIQPYFFSISIITFVFVMDFLFRYLDLFIGKGVAFLVVLEFFILSLGHMFALIIPMSVLPSTLMAFGQLTSGNEITAMKSSGISLYRIIFPVFVASFLLFLGQVHYQNVILPESNHRFLNLYLDIRKMKPTLEIKENIFSSAIQGYTILVKQKNDKTGEIRDVQIFHKTKGNIPTTIIADHGKMYYVYEDNALRFELEDGEIHEMPDPKDISTYRKTLFNHFTLNMKDVDRSLARSERSHRGDREMTVRMMLDRVKEKEQEIEGYRQTMHIGGADRMIEQLSKAAPSLSKERPGGEKERIIPDHSASVKARMADRPEKKIIHDLESAARIIDSSKRMISRYQVEIHKKFSIPFSCIIFVLLGAPLAIRSGKKGMTISIGFSILFFLVYYMFLISGEKLADRQFVSAWLAMWAPNIILLLAAGLLTWSTVRESQTINWAKFNLVKKWRSR